MHCCNLLFSFQIRKSSRDNVWAKAEESGTQGEIKIFCVLMHWLFMTFTSVEALD